MFDGGRFPFREAVPTDLVFYLQLVEQLIVFSMRTNPESNHSIVLQLSDHAIAFVDSGGIDQKSWANLLEPQTWMIGIVLKLTIGNSGLLSDFVG